MYHNAKAATTDQMNAFQTTIMATVDNITATQAQQYSRLNGYIANVQDDAAANEQSSNQLRQLIAQLNLTIGDSIASENETELP